MDFMSTQEAAIIWGDNLYDSALNQAGSIQARKYGNYWMVDKASLEEYLERNQDKSQRDPTRG